MKILIVRTSAMGDVVHALPVLTALRRHLPEAKIGWVVEESMAPLLRGHPDLDELVVVRLRHWRRSLTAQSFGETRTFLSALNRFAPDAVLDLMGNHKAGAISALTLADRRIGFARISRREPSSAIWINEAVVPRGTHAVDRMLSLLDALDLPAEPADFGPEKLFRESTATLENPPFVLLHPGAGWANKVYPAAWWGEAARRIHAVAGVPTWVAVARGEEELAAGAQTAGGEAVRLVPAPDLPALAALIRRARLMLGGDSGPTHLAHALGIPVLMVMGPTDPEASGPYGAPERTVFRRLPCSFCYQRFAETKACLLEIPPRVVAERAVEMLGDTT